MGILNFLFILVERVWKLMVIIGVLFALTLGVGVYLSMPTARFPVDTIFTILPGSSISSVGDKLKAQGYISSSFVFRRLTQVVGKKGIIAGDYYFPTKFSTIEMAKRLTHGVFGIVPAKITIPEGFTIRDIAILFQDKKFFKFDRTEFMALSKEKEGYLYPDTYFFMPIVTAGDIFKTLSDNFDVKIRPYDAAFASSTHSKEDIIKVASIVEKEAATSTDRQIIAGIIWQRLKNGMPLQVDATLGYVLDKGTFQLTTDDLKLDSLYNTYVYKGLPPTPIANPGIDSIEAALYPRETKNVYYLSDKNGKVYYAKTFQEHQQNRENYLGR